MYLYFFTLANYIMPLPREPVKRRIEVRGRLSKERRRELKQHEQDNISPQDVMTRRTKYLLNHPEIKYKKTLDKLLRLYNSSSKRYLPNGIPYAIVDDIYVHGKLAFCISGLRLDIGTDTKEFRLNLPIIFVSSLLSAIEQKDAALHEYTEWMRYKGRGEPDYKAHDFAEKQQNPKLRAATLIRSIAYFRKYFSDFVLRGGSLLEENFDFVKNIIKTSGKKEGEFNLGNLRFVFEYFSNTTTGSQKIRVSLKLPEEVLNSADVYFKIKKVINELDYQFLRGSLVVIRVFDPSDIK